MKLNSISSAPGARKTRLRVGRGASAGQGKTCGRGVKGQRARKGGYHKVGFEGGQMPLQRRLPKVGFRSKMATTVAEVRLSELAKLDGDLVTLETLKTASLIPQQVLRARIVASGTIGKAFTVRGLHLTKGALAALQAAGGRLEAEAAE
ncbi:MAG: 50S ribosomal protein L15 [Steroidobacteraceae bacterium]